MKKDPDAFRAKMEAMEAARIRMQEKYNQVEKTVHNSPGQILQQQKKWQADS